MRIDDELTSFDFDAAIDRVLDTSGNSFSEAAAALNLDAEHNFRHADLRGVDFSESDIRGFNFSGALLSGATGINVIWDKSTVLTGARLDSSIFALERRVSSIFDENEVARAIMRRISGSNDADQIVWVNQNLRAGSRHIDIAAHVAEALLLRTPKPFLKSELLRYVIGPYRSDADTIETILGLLARPDVESVLVRAALDILRRRKLQGKHVVRSTVLALLNSQTAAVRDLALRFVVSTGMSEDDRRIVTGVVARGGVMARTLVELVATRLGEIQDLVVRDPITNEILDPARPVPFNTRFLIARRWLRAETVDNEERAIPLRSRRGGFGNITREAIEKAIPEVDVILRSLSTEGIEYVLDPPDGSDERILSSHW